MSNLRILSLAAALLAAATLAACRDASFGATTASASTAPPSAVTPPAPPSPTSAGLPAPAASGDGALPGAAAPPIDLDGIGHDVGSPNAPVAVVEFADFGCPYCASFARDSWPVIRKKYIDTGKVRWKFVPFVMGTFPNGAEAARAAECAAEQGEPAFWAMYERLFQRQKEWKGAMAPALLLRRYAGDLRLDADRFARCYDADAARARTQAANDAADQLGVRATPTFFVNGRPIEGALPPELFGMVLDEAAR